MIRGRVDASGQAWVPIEIRDNNGRFQTVETILDTGFTGHLTLPPAVVTRLGLDLDIPVDVTLATGTQERVNTRSGYVLWHERLRAISVLESRGNPLLGMRLLAGSQITIQVRVNGDVLIDEELL